LALELLDEADYQLPLTTELNNYSNIVYIKNLNAKRSNLITQGADLIDGEPAVGLDKNNTIALLMAVNIYRIL